jgi:hypothetical protein
MDLDAEWQRLPFSLHPGIVYVAKIVQDGETTRTTKGRFAIAASGNERQSRTAMDCSPPWQWTAEFFVGEFLCFHKC